MPLAKFLATIGSFRKINKRLPFHYVKNIVVDSHRCHSYHFAVLSYPVVENTMKSFNDFIDSMSAGGYDNGHEWFISTRWGTVTSQHVDPTALSVELEMSKTHSNVSTHRGQHYMLSKSIVVKNWLNYRNFLTSSTSKPIGPKRAIKYLIVANRYVVYKPAQINCFATFPSELITPDLCMLHCRSMASCVMLNHFNVSTISSTCWNQKPFATCFWKLHVNATFIR